MYRFDFTDEDLCRFYADSVKIFIKPGVKVRRINGDRHLVREGDTGTRVSGSHSSKVERVQELVYLHRLG